MSGERCRSRQPEQAAAVCWREAALLRQGAGEPGSPLPAALPTAPLAAGGTSPAESCWSPVHPRCSISGRTARSGRRGQTGGCPEWKR